MLISKAPLRVSYLGGGSDFQEFFSHSDSHVVGTTINKYVYTFVNSLQDFAEQRYRFTYRKVESVDAVSELQHPAARAVLEYFEWDSPLNIATLADVPGNSGLGSSSAFVVSLIKALSNLRGLNLNPIEVAEIAVKIEREILKESGGVQDQFHSAVGGFRRYSFCALKASVTSAFESTDVLDFVSDRQWIMPIGGWRSSSEIINRTSSTNTIEEVNAKRAKLAQAALQLDSALVDSSTNKERFYENLVAGVNTSWKLKQEFESVSSPEINQMVNTLMGSGADAVKLCGGGGSGFLLILAKSEFRQNLPKDVNKNWILNARIEKSGCSLTEI